MTDPARVRDLFLEALELPAAERATFLDRACADAGERTEVEELLRHHDPARDFLEVPVERSPLFADLPEHRKHIGGFRLEREIGRGGMGTVHLAVEEKTGHRVALKILSAALVFSPSARARFETEARTAARLEHEAVVPVYHFGEEDRTPFLATEYIEGSTLARELDPHTRLGLAPRPDDFEGVARFVARIARALAHAHENQVLHRDVKPSNILIDVEGRPYLTDFGLARDLQTDGLTQTGDVAGTFSYMSPEQTRGDHRSIDARTDVFSLGVVLYEMLAGERPFQGKTQLETTRAIVEEDPARPRKIRPEVPLPLQTICLKAMEKQPKDRYATVAAMAADLEAFAEGRAIAARPPSTVTRARRLARKKRRGLLTTVGLVLVSALGILGGLRLREPPGTPSEIVAEPSDAQVYLRRMIPDTGAYGPALLLGSTPVRTHLDPGPVRLVIVAADGSGFAELSRRVPDRHELGPDERFRIRVRVAPTDSVLGDMVRIPAGRTVVGSGNFDPRAFGETETQVPAFFIDRHEVTIGQYRRFLEATGRRRPPLWPEKLPPSVDALPAAGVSWLDAREYAEWAGKRLPTYEEWHRAARGGDGRLWPWGNREAPAESLRAWSCVDRLDQGSFDRLTQDFEAFAHLVEAVGSHPRDRSPFGVFDVLGSVSEWCDSPWRRLDGGDRLVVDEALRVVLGANWAFPIEVATVISQSPVGTDSFLGLTTGFRCAKSVDAVGETASDPQR